MSALVIIPVEELQAMLDAAALKAAHAVRVDSRPTGIGEDGYLAIQRAAEFADVHPDTVRAWVKTGRLRAYRAGRELRVLRSELCRFLEVGIAAEHRETAEEEAATILARRRSG